MTEKIELTYGQAEIMLSNKQFTELASKPFPVRISFRLARILKSVQSEMELYIANKKELIEKYAVPNEDGNIADANGLVKFSNPEGPKQIEELASEIIPLTENKIPLNLDECPDLSMQEVMMLLEFIEEEDSNKEE